MATVYDRQEINDATMNPITRLDGNFQWTRPKDDLELKLMVWDYTLRWWVVSHPAQLDMGVAHLRNFPTK